MKKPSRKIIAERLDGLMKATPALGTQVKLAHKSGVGQTTIGRVRRGEVDASADNIRKIAGAFGVPAGYLYGEESAEDDGDPADAHSENDPKEARLLAIYNALPETGENSRDWLLRHAELLKLAVDSQQSAAKPKAPGKAAVEIKSQPRGHG